MTSFWRKLGANAGEKLAWHAGLGLWIALCYYPPQIWPWREAVQMPAWFHEDALPFLPDWSWIYASVFVLHTAALWVGEEMTLIRRYAKSVALSFAIGAVFFWFMPTSLDRPQIQHAPYEWLITRVDGERNVFPSLHAAMATLSVVRFWRGTSTFLRILLVLWWICLIFSTLVTRQHSVVDLVAGALLSGVLCWMMRP